LKSQIATSTIFSRAKHSEAVGRLYQWFAAHRQRLSSPQLQQGPASAAWLGDNMHIGSAPTSIMNRSLALSLLTQHKPILAERFGVTQLALFGSTARDAANGASDVDILVTFDGPATSQRYFGAQFYLEDLLGCAVDLVTAKALRAELRPLIEREAVHV
jgi:predicted nucleotidyltransferase